ncbi:uncharacterized protein LOC131930839 [Physella acuta]|uniref:uncharacterized protein LOC131930839 n=1 Tax=Physella acuta TaxID=109671 RepID=UPI0027DCBF6A|nr:uncharacterized protein LOC131930839 [Physella acuta]
MLMFLIGVEKPDSNLAKIKVLAEESTGNDEDNPSNLNHCDEVLENGEVHTEDTQVYRRPRKRKVWGTSTPTFDTIVNVNRPNDHAPSPQYENQFTAFARHVEAELREIKNGRRLLILKKKIQDLIFETKLEEMDNNC